MLMRFSGMSIGHLSCGNMLEYTAGVSDEALESGLSFNAFSISMDSFCVAYEYGESAGLESNDNAAHSRDVQEELGDADNNAETSDEESIGGHTDSEEDGEMIRDWDDEDEASW
jgi:hypothetical protein